MIKMKKYFTEMIGTFVLVLGGCGTAIFGGVGFLGVALAFGLTVVAMAYGIGNISGAHLNPAVSVGVFCAGRINAKDLAGYVVFQIIGGILAAALLAFFVCQTGGVRGTFAANGFGNFFGAEDVAAGYRQISLIGAFTVEMILTFVFLIVILGVTDKKSTPGFAGLAIGLTLALIHLISIPLTNTSVNPARSISQAIFSENALALPQLWLFIVAPCVGAALAAFVWKAISSEKAK